MILPSSQKSSVIKPSQPKMAAVGDPHGGEIPMRSICVDRLMCSRLGDIEDKYQPKQGDFVFGEIPMLLLRHIIYLTDIQPYVPTAVLYM